MNGKMMQFVKVILLMSALSAVIIAAGCKKKAQPTSPSEPNKTQAAPAAVEQTICPVMGGKINKDIFVEYQGRKVYFCCPACKEQFEKEPDKYIAKLPQFQK